MTSDVLEALNSIDDERHFAYELRDREIEKMLNGKK
jgi:hypothetical protein